MEERALYNAFTTPNKDATMEEEPYVRISRQSLETEHRQLLSRLHELRRLLGYTPLLTGKERRRQE